MLQNDLLHKIFQINPEPMALSRLEDGRYIDVNLAFLHAFGYARDEVIGRTAEEIGIWENPERDRSPIVAQLSERGYVADYEATFRTKNGELLQFLLGATRIDTDDGPILLIVGRNITEIRRSEARYRSFIEGLPLGVLIAQDGIVQYGNPAGLELSGYELDEVVGKPFLLWVDEADREFLIANHQRRMQGDEADTCYDLRVMAKGGNKRYWRVHASTVTWEGRAAGLVAFSDVTAQKLAEARVTDLALHDIVTGLPNRRLLTERAAAAVADAETHGKGFAVFYLDLDNFKAVNDRFGHDIGDQVLGEIAQRLRNSTRESDTAARVGGDEFVLLALGISDCSSARALAAKMVASINRPVMTGAGEQHVGTSVGIALYPRNGDNLDALLHSADEAMYLAKRSGNNGIRCAERKVGPEQPD